MECKKDENKIGCSCTYTSCSTRGMCCDCVRYHRENDEIPGCFFSASGERTYEGKGAVESSYLEFMVLDKIRA